jgi:serine/threonine-protein kinase
MDDMRYSPPKAIVDDVAADPGAEIPDKVLKKIRTAWIACLVSAAMTLVMIAVVMNTGQSKLGLQGPIDLIDVGFILGMAFGISRKSRVCAVLMLAYFAFSKYLIIRATGQLGSVWLGLVFLYFYAQGVVGTFEYHKLRKARAS